MERNIDPTSDMEGASGENLREETPAGTQRSEDAREPEPAGFPTRQSVFHRSYEGNKQMTAIHTVTVAVIPDRTGGVAMCLDGRLAAALSIRPSLKQHLRPDTIDASCILARLVQDVEFTRHGARDIVIEKPAGQNETTAACIRDWLSAAAHFPFRRAFLMNRRGWRAVGRTEAALSTIQELFGPLPRDMSAVALDAALLALFFTQHRSAGRMLGWIRDRRVPRASAIAWAKGWEEIPQGRHLEPVRGDGGNGESGD